MLTKMVDGQTVILSDDEEAQTRASWAMNEKYPLYSGAIGFDGINPPFADIDAAKKIHMQLINGYVMAKIADINTQIETAQEDGDDTTTLFAQRKAMRASSNPDLSNVQTLDDLMALLPADIGTVNGNQ